MNAINLKYFNKNKLLINLSKFLSTCFCQSNNVQRKTLRTEHEMQCTNLVVTVEALQKFCMKFYSCKKRPQPVLLVREKSYYLQTSIKSLCFIKIFAMK